MCTDPSCADHSHTHYHNDGSDYVTEDVVCPDWCIRMRAVQFLATLIHIHTHIVITMIFQVESAPSSSEPRDPFSVLERLP